MAYLRKILFFIGHLFIRELNEIMIVELDAEKNKLKLFNWHGNEIFTKKFSLSLFEKIKPYCKLEGKNVTTIYIWAGDEKKFLAYNEPIENYLSDPNLLFIGQGFPSTSDVKYGDVCKLKCPACGQYYP